MSCAKHREDCELSSVCPGYVDDSAWFPFVNAVTVERLEVEEEEGAPKHPSFFFATAVEATVLKMSP